ncbi:MAG: hypothetical protein LIP12_05975, partial [Clostridiales bacterium]|nr:hypothetical protein [Clostridiales bacterium]
MKKKPLKGSIFICIVLIFAAYLYHIWEKDREREAEARETYRQAEELIEQGLYEKADEILEQIRGLQYTELEYTGSAITGGGNLMFSDFDAQTRQMLTGNLLMIGCCAFYLAWWLIAFRPEDAVKGIRSGWLLIPALLFGVAAVT